MFLWLLYQDTEVCETGLIGFEHPQGWVEPTVAGPGVLDCVSSYGTPQVRHFRVDVELGEVAFFEIQESVPWTLVSRNTKTLQR